MSSNATAGRVEPDRDAEETDAEPVADADVTDETDQSERTLSKDEAFHLLQNGRRRAVLRHLLEADGEGFEMGDVTDAVAAWEHDTTVDELDSDERQRVYISLYQVHLPTLDEHDVVEYDQSRGTVTVEPIAHSLDPFLGSGLHADPWLEADSDEDGDVERDRPGGLLGRLFSR